MSRPSNSLTRDKGRRYWPRIIIKKCYHCGTKKSAHWRNYDSRTLCNAWVLFRRQNRCLSCHTRVTEEGIYCLVCGKILSCYNCSASVGTISNKWNGKRLCNSCYQRRGNGCIPCKSFAPDSSIYCMDCIDPAENWLEKVAEEIRTGKKHIWISIRRQSNRIKLMRGHTATANTEKNNPQNISKSKCLLKVAGRCRRWYNTRVRKGTDPEMFTISVGFVFNLSSLARTIFKISSNPNEEGKIDLYSISMIKKLLEG